MRISKSWQIYLISIILMVSAIPVFHSLDYLPFRLFDESRLACSAMEMNRDHDFLVVHYKGNPEMWSVKPPLMIWCQVFFMKIVGENELAVRLPAALCGMLTIFLTFLFLSKSTGLPVLGFAASIVLAATPGYIFEHGTRTGDYDSMLVLFLMMQFVSFFLFLNDTSRKKYWYLACLAVVLGVYTKGIAGLMFLPGLFLYALLSKKMLHILRSRETWIGVILSLICVFGYYGLRELYNPGYIHKVIENEITYRYFDVNEGHEGKWNFYLDYLINTGYAGWYLFALAGMVAGFISTQKLFKNVVLYSSLNVFIFLIIISASQTKIQWYALPVFPLLAILVATCFFYIYDIMSDKLKGSIVHLKWIPVAIFAVLVISNYNRILKYVTNPVELNNEESIYSLGYVFQKAQRGEVDLDGIYYCYPPYNAHLHFYTSILETKGQKVTLIEKEKLKSGFKVLAGSREIQDFISVNYKVEVLKTWNNNVQLLLIR